MQEDIPAILLEKAKQFPGVKNWLDKTRVEAAQTGSVETLLGRKRYFPNLKAGTGCLRAY